MTSIKFFARPNLERKSDIFQSILKGEKISPTGRKIKISWRDYFLCELTGVEFALEV